ncbi:MAG TPA: hypothetical protein GX707_11690 [Epulopiscium sp.]|nr:hypothetical protein [Candidatus Epulonipiscium sp.]
MSRKRIITIIILVIIPFVGYYYLKNNIISVGLLFNIENLVGVIAILSGITGIVIGFSSSRQASLDAVKDYFQQGDEESYVKARTNILETKSIDKMEKTEVGKVCNFFHFWGLMNRKKYLPIWVFEGSSGLQVVKLYIKLQTTIKEKRKLNQFYAIEFEKLARRIYRKYNQNFISLKDTEWEKGLEEFNRTC